MVLLELDGRSVFFLIRKLKIRLKALAIAAWLDLVQIYLVSAALSRSVRRGSRSKYILLK